MRVGHLDILGVLLPLGAAPACFDGCAVNVGACDIKGQWQRSPSIHVNHWTLHSLDRNISMQLLYGQTIVPNDNTIVKALVHKYAVKIYIRWLRLMKVKIMMILLENVVMEPWLLNSHNKMNIICNGKKSDDKQISLQNKRKRFN